MNDATIAKLHLRTSSHGLWTPCGTNSVEAHRRSGLGLPLRSGDDDLSVVRLTVYLVHECSACRFSITIRFVPVSTLGPPLGVPLPETDYLLRELESVVSLAACVEHIKYPGVRIRTHRQRHHVTNRTRYRGEIWLWVSVWLHLANITFV